jgi:hypothetical protein
MVKSKKLLVMKTLEAKNEMTEKKNKEKEAKWSMLREDAKRKTDIEERRARAENAAMMMNPAEMDESVLSGGIMRRWRY